MSLLIAEKSLVNEVIDRTGVPLDPDPEPDPDPDPEPDDDELELLPQAATASAVEETTATSETLRKARNATPSFEVSDDRLRGRAHQCERRC
ncbi:MAG: hypothetical protein M3Z50_12375 [Actinomycetota bacterium]|nr:hypothetical protein [Actinomycetota bacterium]